MTQKEYQLPVYQTTTEATERQDSHTLDPQHDPMGMAIAEYHRTGRAGKLRVLSSMFDDDEIPVAHLFRTWAQMPRIEQEALVMAQGRTLDVGAGAGCHSLILQQRGLEVDAIDISPLSCETMKLRGVERVQCINLYDKRLTGPYDTILLLMNGTGIVGRLRNMPNFLERLHGLLAPGGKVLVDSTDLKYLYENEDGTYDIDPLGEYYGQVDYQMAYRKVKGERFDWLYVDYETLRLIATSNGFGCRRVVEGEHYDYLAELTKL